MQENYYDDDKQFDDWLDVRSDPTSRIYMQILPAIEKLMGNIVGDHILDYGCGTGTITDYFAHFGPEYILGTDISEKFIEFAKSNYKFFSNLDFKLLEPSNNNLKDITGEFDKIYSLMALQYIQDIGPTLANIRRLLKPGGHAILAVPHVLKTAEITKAEPFMTPQGLKSPTSDYLLGGERTRDVIGSDNPNTIYHRTFSEWTKLLTRNKLHIVDCEEPSPSPEELELHPQTALDINTPHSLIFKVEKFGNVFPSVHIKPKKICPKLQCEIHERYLDFP